MRKKYKSYAVGLLALLFMGITFPELIYTDDTVQVVDENGDEIIDFSELPGDAIDHIKELYDSVDDGKVVFRISFLETKDEKNLQEKTQVR